MRPFSKENSTPLSKNCRKIIAISFSLFISFSTFAHYVDGYTSACMSGPVYSIDAKVSVVNNSSNYAWQYRNLSNAWVCIVNGNNTINGAVYSISGATSTATTNPAPIVINNAAGLQGLVIRCVISDGNGVNPCNTPYGNTWNSGSNSTNFTINVSNTPCALLQLGNRVWYDANNNGVESNEDGIANITVKLYKDDNNDNVADGASIASTTTNTDGYYTFSNLQAGNYIVGVILPNGYVSSNVNGGDPDNNINGDDNGQVLMGNEIRGLAITLQGGTEPNGNSNNTNYNDRYDFGLLPDCGCSTAAGNLLVNPGFENGTTGWSASNGTVTTGTAYKACGSYNGYNNWNSGTSRVWQDVVMVAGSTVTLSAFAGTHTGGIGCNPNLSLIFLNASNVILSQSAVIVTRDVDKNHSQLEQYTITAIAPAGTAKVRVQSAINCNVMKLDGLCLSAIAPSTIGDFVWQDFNGNGIQDGGEPGLPGVQAVLKDNNGNTIANTVTDAAGAYQFNNLPPGSYNITFNPPPGYISSPPNNGADDTKDSDPVNGTANNIVLTPGQTETTIDAGFIRLVTINGNVWHDVNAMSDGFVNNSGSSQVPPAAAIPPGMRAYLVNSSTGLIEQATFVNSSTGTYSFSNVTANSVYTVVLSITQQIPGNSPPASNLPSGWINTGQKLGVTAGSDGINDGKLVIPVGNSDVINANFGIKLEGGDTVLG
jgi:SdrD B-like domain